MRSATSEANPDEWGRFDDAMMVASGALPAALAAMGAASAPPASHDDAVVRAVGLGWTGLWRGMDAMLAAPMMLLPFGTRAFRAAIASALVTAACGAIAFVGARRLARAAQPVEADPRLTSAVAAASVLAALMGPLWQSEGSVPGGAVTGALVVVTAIALAQDTALAPAARAKAMGVLVGLGVAYDPMAGLAVVGAVAPAAKGVLGDRRAWLDLVLGLLLGLAPFGVAAALAARASESTFPSVPWANALGENAGAKISLASWATAEIGGVVLIAAAAGAALAAFVSRPPARAWLASIGGVIAAGALAILERASAGPSRVSAVVLAAVLAVHLLAAIALTAAVVAIASAKVPFARASATLVVVLELVLPVRAADETFGRREARAPRATAIWNEIAWGTAPPAAVLLVSDPSTMRRIAASRAVGQMRRDLLVVPAHAVRSRQADRALLAEPKLAPLYRDLALGSTPEELSLAQLASHRALLVAYDPKWDRNLARHFVPVGLTSRFEPEPRGASDRRRALDDFLPFKDRLIRIAVAKRDADLTLVTAAMLRVRAVAIAACGERDVLSRALDDLRPFAPDDATANALVRRIVTTKGPIEVRDLTP